MRLWVRERGTLALFARVGAGVGAGTDAGSGKRPKLACEPSLAGGAILHQPGLAQNDAQPTKRCENCIVDAIQVRGKKPNTPIVNERRTSRVHAASHLTTSHLLIFNDS